MNTIAGLLCVENVILDLETRSKADLLDVIGRRMEHDLGLPWQSVAQALLRREQLSSTGLGSGFAIPHARVKDLERVRIEYARLKTPIPFDAPDGEPVFEILVLLVPKEVAEEHLRILAEATQMFSDPSFRARLRQCEDASAAMRQFAAWPCPPREDATQPGIGPVRLTRRAGASVFRRVWPFPPFRWPGGLANRRRPS